MCSCICLFFTQQCFLRLRETSFPLLSSETLGCSRFHQLHVTMRGIQQFASNVVFVDTFESESGLLSYLAKKGCTRKERIVVVEEMYNEYFVMTCGGRNGIVGWLRRLVEGIMMVALGGEGEVDEGISFHMDIVFSVQEVKRYLECVAHVGG